MLHALLLLGFVDGHFTVLTVRYIFLIFEVRVCKYKALCLYIYIYIYIYMQE